MATKIYPKWKIQIKPMIGIVFKNEDAFNEHLIPLMSDTKTYDLVIKPESKSRSRQEEKFYHAVVVRMVAESMGIEDNDAHDLMRGLFLEREFQTESGKRYKRILSTTELDDIQYREYWQKCIKWAALPTSPEGLSVNSGIELYIPEPNEADYESYI